MSRQGALEGILPASVCVATTPVDVPDVTLFPEEEAAVRSAVPKRRREFVVGRACARRALAALGRAPAAVPAGCRGEPRWPAGVVGSITHCRGYGACAVAEASAFAAIGIDAEPHAPLPDGVLGAIARADELSSLRTLAREAPEVHWDRLLFSAKESVFKACFPLARRGLGFDDALLSFDRNGIFSARVAPTGPSGVRPALARLSGRWAVRDGLVVTAIALESRRP